MRKRIIATLMVLCMALSLLPVQVLAAEGAAQKAENAEQTTGAAKGSGADGAYANGADTQVALLQSTEETYQITVRTLTGEDITLDVTSDDSIGAVKEKIRQQENIPVWQQRLTLDGSELEDGKTLADYNIQAGNTVQMIRLTGAVDEESLRNAVAEGGDVKLLSTTGIFTISSTLVISSYIAVTLDLNGCVLRMTGSGSVFKVEKEGSLTVTDSSTENREHAFTVGSDGLWVLDDKGNETITGGVITTGENAANGGVYLEEEGWFTLEGGSIVGCRASGSGGGVYVEKDGWFTMKGGSIVGCRAGEYGGGVYLEENGKFTLEKGSIVGCRAGEYGGGVYLSRQAWMAMTGGEIAGCTAGQDPSTGLAGQDLSAGLYLRGGRLSANGGTIKDEVFSAGTIDSAAGKAGCTEFQARVTNQVIPAEVSLDGKIRHGRFNETVVNQNGGIIDGGTFLGDVENIDAHIGAGFVASGGTFYGNVTNGGTDEAKGVSSIFEGTFYGKVTNGRQNGPEESARIRGGTFRGEVTNEKSGDIKSGTFYSGITNEGGTVGKCMVTYKIGETVYAQQVVPSGKTATDPWESRDGYTFDGWYTPDGTLYDFNTVVTESLTLTGKWRIDFEDVSNEAELRDALTQKKVGIRLAKDIDIESTLNITGELVLNLNDHVLKMTRDGSVFVIDGGGRLTVMDSATNKTTRCFRKGTDGLWTLLTDGTTSENTVTGGIIYGGSAGEGGGVRVENGTLIMRGGSIVGCRAIEPESGSGSGGGVLVNEYGRFEMYDGAGIYGCTAGKIDGDGGHGGHGAAVEIDGDGGVEENGMFFMYGGTIESCVSGSGGGGVCNDGVFVMEGGSIQNCSAVGVGGAEGRGGSIRFNGSTTISGDAEISAPNNGKLHIAGSKTLTISGAAKIKASITHGGTLCADGGTVIGVVEIRGSITGSEGATGTTTFTKAVESSGTIENGVFEGEVTNKESGTIKGGTFKKKVENEGTIEGGTFEGTVRSRTSYGAEKAAVIRDGTFNGHVESYSSIENGVFAGEVESEGTISGGTFTGTVMNKVGSTIEGGTFEKKVANEGTIENGVFKGEVTNGGTITGGAFHGEVTCDGRLDGGSGGPLVGGTVSGGSFDQTIQVIYGTIIGEAYSDWEKTRRDNWQKQYVLTYQADGEAYAWQVLGDGFFPVMPQGPDKEGHTFLSWFYVGGKNDGEKVDEGDPPNENSTAVARYATGSGTEQDPCRIGSMEELLLFRLQVNRFGRTALCAVLTNDIVINSGTFDADGRYTPTAGETVNDLYAIGSKERPYTGTFDGGGYTVRGLCCSNKDIIDSTVQDAVYPAGLFGWLKGATVKNLTVTGYVDGRACVGGIAGYADAGTTILNCRNECVVRSVDLFNREYGPAQYAGGIVGYNEGSVTACYNAGTVTGIDSVGGITGGPAGAVSDCYNVGTVTGSSHVGGITGSGGTVSYCYNVGTVTGDSNVGGISGSGAQVNDCFFLGTQGRSAEEFADGTVLTELIAGRSQHPWGDVCCPPLKASSLAAQPVLRWQQQPLTMDTSDAAMKCGETQAARPVGGAFGTLTYTSSDPAIASVASGVITAHKAGTVTITAASGTDGYYASSVSYQLTVSHSYTAQHDAGYHWQACACGDVTGRSAHSWVNGGCADCGYACGHADTELRNAKKASCTEDGYTGDTYCRDCGEKLQSGTVIKAAGHTGGTATCVSGALCTVCGQPYGQKDAGNHDLKRTAAKEPGVFVSGHIEYWQCSACGKYFADANGAKEISREDTIIPRERREKDAEPVKAPGTGDPGIALYGVTALLSLTGCAWLRRKKK